MADFAAQMESRRWASREVLRELRSKTRDLALRSTALNAQLSRRLPEQKCELSAWMEALDDLDDDDADGISADLAKRAPIKAALSRPEPDAATQPETTTKRDLRHAIRREVDRPKPDNAAILLAGLSFLLVRYNPALEVSYYHQILSELVPSSVLTEIALTVSIPQWQGTSGWVSERARLLANQWPEFKDSPQPVVLYSAISDARGRNTVNRYVLGSRSWLGIPFFGDGDRPAGIVVITFPLDGLFYDVGMEVSPFAQRFQQLVGSARSDLLRALRMDARASVFPMGPPPSTRVWERDRVGEQARRLLPDFPTPDDPLGLLAVIQGSQLDLALPEVHIQVRRRSPIDPLYELVELASTFPDETSPTATRVLDMMTKEAHRNDLAWHLQDQGDDMLAELYPEDARDVERKLREIRHHLKEQRPDVSLRTLHDALKSGLQLAKGVDEREVIDLVVPLSRGEQVEGYIRFNCVRHSHSNEAFVSMYTTIRKASKKLRDTLGPLLATLAQRVTQSRSSLTRLKLLSSLRASLCEAVAWEIARAFYPNDHQEPELRRFDLLRAAARSLNVNLSLDATRRAINVLCREIEEKRSEFPTVILVSFWLHAERPVVKGIKAEPNGLSELFMADRSFVRMLHLLVEHHFNAPGSRLEHHDTYWHRRDGDQFVVIPPAYRTSLSTDKELPLELRVERHGKSVETHLSTGDGWQAELTWGWRRYPRPMAYQPIPRGITHSLFGDVRAVSMAVINEDLDERMPEALVKEWPYRETILSRAKKLIDFLSFTRHDQTLWWRARRLEPRGRRPNARAWLWAVDRGSAEEEARRRALREAAETWRMDGELMEYGQRRFYRHSIASPTPLQQYLEKRAKVDTEAKAALGAFNRLKTLIAIDTGGQLWVSTDLGELLAEMMDWYKSDIEVRGKGRWSFDDAVIGDVVLLLDNLLTNAIRNKHVKVEYAARKLSATVAITNHGEMPPEWQTYLNSENGDPPRSMRVGARHQQGLGIVREIVERSGWALAASCANSLTTVTITFRRATRWTAK